MQHLFTYGTLKDLNVQEQVFGHTLKGEQDVLEAFRISPDKIMGRYLVAEKTNSREDQIEGIVYELKQSELTMADLYEGEAYKKIEVGLKSGKIAWVYVKA
ncbi:gamma-glutamylcyclotransferase family protein [Zobellia sp. 1_MG-2023]|uniref:gamma-glutamylcyclotransferase family protein n=1 Tax=Zobellia sp. 1_MG-2023 TaxID=3062626 RepID=UPI0026E45674|nr:gamma-glutamylcyclotransferase family protein [Zobellia sp. 1_MG-2023]MDO6817782.1 gamma-glutamylcyclotransferase family protein [Zobellia sp. 1_MG-2023]